MTSMLPGGAATGVELGRMVLFLGALLALAVVGTSRQNLPVSSDLMMVEAPGASGRGEVGLVAL
jgi:hypothetical protein